MVSFPYYSHFRIPEDIFLPGHKSPAGYRLWGFDVESWKSSTLPVGTSYLYPGNEGTGAAGWVPEMSEPVSCGGWNVCFFFEGGRKKWRGNVMQIRRVLCVVCWFCSGMLWNAHVSCWIINFEGLIKQKKATHWTVSPMIAGVWSNIRQRQRNPPVCSNGSQFPLSRWEV